MSLQEKQVYESNTLAFKFACIIQVFELLSTILYAAERVGFMTTATMAIPQAIILVISVVCFFMFRTQRRGKIYLMICKIKRARDARNEKNFDNKLNNFAIC